jgi:hypothetical protein
MAALIGLVLLVAVDGGGGGPLQEPEPEVVEASLPVRDAFDRRLDCIAWFESKNDALAYNRSSGASGLLQFLPSTWRSTPQGRAGRSIWDPAAQWQAGRYMLQAGRAREWVPVQRGWC